MTAAASPASSRLPQAALRPPATVMRLSRMGASFPTRLSFLPTLLRRLAQENVTVTRPHWSMDADGFGEAVYTLRLGGFTYSLVALTQPLDASARSDRVIAEAWDAAFVLYDGTPNETEIARIRANAPLQEAGRFTERDLVLSRANKSVRLFAEVVSALREGREPDVAMIRDCGYLMRTTAVYGNGKFGIADRARIAERPGLSGPFMAEMLTVWLIRGFTHDLVEHLGGAPLERDLKRDLGIGNSTGLGMAPFLVSHPLLLDAWMQVRETALARVRAIERLDADQIAALYGLLERAADHLAGWNVADPQAQARIDCIRAEWPVLAAWMTPERLTNRCPLYALMGYVERFCEGTQELAVAMILQPFGELIDELASCMASPHQPRLEPAMGCADLRSLIEDHAGFTLGVDYAEDCECARFWYVSEEKLEPRLGDRHSEDGATRESPLDIARRIAGLHDALEGEHGSLAEFLLRHPDHRFAARRVQTLARHPYSEIRDNLIHRDCLPIDMLRCKLSFFGASRFDPKSDLWTRITLAQGAPLSDELPLAEGWWLGGLPQTADSAR